MIRLWLLRLLAPPLGRAPAFGYRVAALVGWCAWRLNGRQRRIIVRNLLPFCDGDRARARRESLHVYQNVARYWVDLCSLPYRDLSGVERAHLTIVDGERLAVLEQPGPVIAVSAHTGNPEFAIQALTHRGRAFIAMVEELRPPRFSRELLRRRSSAGGKFYEVNLGGLRACLDGLKRGELIGINGDRDLQGSGVCVPLAGRMARLPRGPWELARRSGAVVLPVFTHRDARDHLTLFVQEPFTIEHSADAETDVRKAAERFAALLETHIRREPGQWVVLEDFWKAHGCGQG